jgi:hypothetical protein
LFKPTFADAATSDDGPYGRSWRFSQVGYRFRSPDVHEASAATVARCAAQADPVEERQVGVRVYLPNLEQKRPPDLALFVIRPGKVNPEAGKTPLQTFVVITGASSGLGAEAARHLAKAGAKLAHGARRLDRLEALPKELSVGQDQVVGPT